MNKQLYFLKQDGWFEYEMTGNQLTLSLDELISWAYDIMKRERYRNYIIKEGPHPLPPLQNGEGPGVRSWAKRRRNESKQYI